MLKRLNINMSEKLVEWYDKRAEEMGVSRSAVMCMAMQEYMEQKTTINVMEEFKVLAEQMKLAELAQKEIDANGNNKEVE